MRAKMIGGLLMLGLLSAGCGGAATEPAVDAEALEGQEQTLAAPACAAGYTEYLIWDCERTCPRSGNANVLNRYCTNGTDEYLAGAVSRSCGACY
ncbi:hypothetical protein SAMN05444354_116154 [Stigmatella aurantiaca]|uniref:Lipoprotein n=1 Tax=Stigmatella aurantiaca TaxID=41 RepID=A0A1H7YBI5_STIAU|nr:MULTISPECIES: hypothetical protein [Stigmatella]SEM42698.1 hypothetical protein SAMN05444354_116154 [Stigmatella aurantiaca]